MKILVTGHAGFIGFHTARCLLQAGHEVVGFDNVNDYYDTELKEARLIELEQVAAGLGSAYRSIRGNLADRAAVESCFDQHCFDRVIHLAAQAGVRYSIENPHAYVESNLVGFANVLECCRQKRVEHLIYASTSSVYGANTKMPFSEQDSANHPVQFYAATKRSNELMAHSYSHLFQLPTTGLRFFTVYGPWGRPDMAPHLFTSRILRGQPIQVFNQGNHSRDFTYIDDIVESIMRVADGVALPDPNWNSDSPAPSCSRAPYRIYNIGNSHAVRLADFIAAIERATGRTAVKEYLPLQPGDVADTFADSSALQEHINYRPSTSIEEGVSRFVQWYREYYDI
ncbi:NAD-dependent epimerase [Marinobacterium sp. AK62]|uniref:NAD-dependent epimerase n=1 Tax=Marinobacterium alkalitolerans TaxID=1542925 RepID=A0ABS3Z663_9GAMM|nr:NAD-dependent epimerase [Marinobacterium alkalitolerans]MBP0047202.1 NAD-dependent epimerase [Marinobacterium alkalitolerans]